MLTLQAYPNALFSSATKLPFVDIWSNIATLYKDAAQANTQQLFLSSTRIIQEHTLRAFTAASQACSDALAKNAMSVQQESMGRFFDANQKAMGVMGEAFTQAWTGSLAPVK